MNSRSLILGAALGAALFASPARAGDNSVTIGLILPMTGPSASTGKQERAASELYMHEHGDTVAGKKINLIVKDDTGAADVTKRLAEELIGNDHASVLMGFGLTPLALAAAPVATEAKVPEIVTAAGSFMVRLAMAALKSSTVFWFRGKTPSLSRKKACQYFEAGLLWMLAIECFWGLEGTDRSPDC